MNLNCHSCRTSILRKGRVITTTTKELTLSNNCKFVRCSRIIVQLKMEHDVWQPIFDQPYILSQVLLEIRFPKLSNDTDCCYLVLPFLH